MMGNLLATPHPDTNDFTVDAADWVEINCLFKDDGNISREDLIRALMRAGAIRDERAEELASDVFLELEDRVSACGNRKNAINSYPFFLNSDKTVLQIRYRFKGSSNVALLYWFLLVVSRSEMSSRERVLDRIDPTKVFEVLCADILRNFWGGAGEFSGSFVFGTAARGRNVETAFRKKIATLCGHIGEGVGSNDDASPPGGGDGQVDVVTWRKFRDGRQGNLLGFAQCKTGSHWKDHLTKLQPVPFSRRYFQRELVVPPVRLYMVPVRVHRIQWRDHSELAGIVLDRCRITQYRYGVDPKVLLQCRTWVKAVLQREGQNRRSGSRKKK